MLECDLPVAAVSVCIKGLCLLQRVAEHFCIGPDLTGAAAFMHQFQ